MSAAAAGVVVALFVAAQAPRERLKAVGEELGQEQLDVDRLLSEEGSLLSAIEAAARDEEGAQHALRDAQGRRDQVEARLGEAREQETKAAAEAEARLRVLGPRLRAWQRLSPARRIALLLSAADGRAAGERATALRLILGKDLGEVRAALAGWRAAQAERLVVVNLEAELRARAAEAGAAEIEAALRRKRHRALLVAVREERGLHERSLEELKVAQQKLTLVVASLPAETMPSTHFAEARGMLPPPVEGRIELGFGPILNPRFNTVTLQKGIDLRAHALAPVRAVHRGRVVHAGRFAGYGNLVIVDHGDGYFTLFAHLASMTAGVNDLVEAGDVLGTVGETGSLKGPYLHFEIRRHGEALDPAPWLSRSPLEAATDR